MVTSFNKQWVWFCIVYTQLIISGLGAALTAKIDKSNTVRTTNITMQSLKSILRLWKFIGSIILVFLLKSQVVLVCFIIFFTSFLFKFSYKSSVCTITKLKSIYKKREREHLKTNMGLYFKCIKILVKISFRAVIFLFFK